MLDWFSLTGHGPAVMRNGFLGSTVENFATAAFSVDPIWVKGDPGRSPTSPSAAIRSDVSAAAGHQRDFVVTGSRHRNRAPDRGSPFPRRGDRFPVIGT